MIKYNWKTRMYEVWAGLRPMVVADVDWDHIAGNLLEGVPVEG